MDIIDRNRTLQIVNADEVKTIAEWESQYPDLWMLIELTRSDQWEVYEGKLVATAIDPIELVEIGKSYDQKGIMTLETRGDYSEPQPALLG